MLPLARDGLTADAVQAALHAKGGSRMVRFRYYIIKNGVRAGELPVVSGSVRYAADDEIQRTASFELAGEPDINWLLDLIQPVMEIAVGNKWASFPLGVFVPSTPTRTVDGQNVRYNVEAYDRTIYAREDCLIDRTFYASGTPYLDVIESLLLSCGISDIQATASGLALPTDREFDIGTSKLDVINTLLAEINYNPLTLNADGQAVLSAYQQPSADRVGYSYRADELSVLASAANSVTDLYNVPNIFIAVISNSEQQPIKAMYVNDNPSSELSTVRRRRNIVSPLYKPDAIASAEELDTYIRRIAFEQSQVYEAAEIQTALMPIHEAREVLEIRHPQLSGIYEETGWEMTLSPGGAMTHQIRRIVQI